MDKLSLVKKYFSFSMGLWLNAVISFITTPIVTWLIDPSQFGKSTMFSTFYSIMLILATAGTQMAFMRFFPQKPEEKKSELVWSCLAFPLLFSTVLSLVTLIFSKPISFFLVEESSYRLVIVLILSLVTGVFQTFNQTMIQMKGKGMLYSTVNVTRSLSNVVFIVIYAYFVNKDFYAIIYAQLFSNIVSLVIGILFEHNYWFPIRISKDEAIEVIKYGFPFIFSSIMMWLLSWTDRFVLRIFTNFNEIGLYSAAFKIVTAVSLFTSGFGTLWYPFAFEQYEKNPENKAVFSKALDYTSFIFFSIGFVILGLKNVIFLLLAKSYRPAASISPFLLLSVFIPTINTIVVRGIDFSKKTYWFIISDSCGVVFNLIGNFLLIPVLGSRGAAMSTGLSYVILLIIEGSVSEKLYPVGYNLKRVYYVILLFSLTALVHTFFNYSLFPMISSVSALLIMIYLYKTEFKVLVSEARKALLRIGGNA